MKSSLNILDVVATKKAFPKHHLLDGQVGTVIEILADGFVEVEFHLKKKDDPTLIPLHEKELIKLHFELKQA
ncbi:DUF4926 domain-containing protein [Gracilimonas mengyeensis]|uniref:DUF4926 domain-containing protein n=1 Tax=Gracilimonas mengyeensis TaxID=1302730 RepID=A0A521D500_9BACT|nr:DUF4926 domain-containing protein [Gracilimonas mengyeensis]SMO66783.1 protein of unknown function [Gracilimonas mengyeensis]